MFHLHVKSHFFACSAIYCAINFHPAESLCRVFTHFMRGQASRFQDCVNVHKLLYLFLERHDSNGLYSLSISFYSHDQYAYRSTRGHLLSKRCVCVRVLTGYTTNATAFPQLCDSCAVFSILEIVLVKTTIVYPTNDFI